MRCNVAIEEDDSLSPKKIAEALAGKTHPELYKIDLLLQTLGYRLTIQPQT